MKEGGKNKSDFKRFTLLETTSHTIRLNERKSLQSLKEIIQLVKENKKWSAFVANKWNHQYSLAQKCTCIRNLEVQSDQLHFNVSDKDNCFVYNVIVSNESVESAIYANPTCNCQYFKTTLIPCRHICATFFHVDKELFVEGNLAKRWKIKYHPLYEKALEQLQLKPPGNEEKSLVKDTFIFNKKLYDNIVYPSADSMKYATLHQAALEVVNFASKCGDTHKYKIALMSLTELYSKLTSLDSTNQTEQSQEAPFIPRPPARRKTGKFRKSDENLSVLNNAKRCRIKK